MTNNIVILSGSPRKDGNTDMLVTAFKDGAESAGKNVTVFRVADMNIGGCTGCEVCSMQRGVCVQRDDMPPVLDAVKAADALVLASPIYFFSVTAQLKLAIDRLYAIHREKDAKRCALLTCCGDEAEDTADGAAVMFRAWMKYANWEDAGVIVAVDVHEKGEITGHKALDEAKELGRTI